MLLRGMDSSEKVKYILCSRGYMEYPGNVPNCCLYQVPPTLKISWKSVQPLFRNVANRQTDKQTTPGNGQRWKHNLRHGGGKKLLPYRNVYFSFTCVHPYWVLILKSMMYSYTVFLCNLIATCSSLICLITCSNIHFPQFPFYLAEFWWMQVAVRLIKQDWSQLCK